MMLLQWKGNKEEWAFLLLFPENKEDKENREQAWTYCFLLELLLILHVYN